MFYIFNLVTKQVSKKSWKTYIGALNHCEKYCIVSTKDGIDWALRHLEWCDERIKGITGNDDEPINVGCRS